MMIFIVILCTNHAFDVPQDDRNLSIRVKHLKNLCRHDKTVGGAKVAAMDNAKRLSEIEDDEIWLEFDILSD